MDPGALYVIGTLLPLAAFVLLFLGGKRWPGKTGGLVAALGIGGAFICAAIGFALFLSEMSGSHAPGDHAPGDHAPGDHHPARGRPTEDDQGKKDDHQRKEDTGHGHAHGHAAAAAHHAPPVWSGSLTFLRLTGFGSHAGALDLQLGYQIDVLAALMFLMVTFVATLIHIFALGYMSEELQPTVDDHQAHVKRKGRYPRFFMWFAIFSFSMLNLVIANNLFQVFISWELVGICSYGLIGFYYERRSATSAANKAFITNRVGDAGFIIGILILWTYCGSLSFGSVTETGKVDEEDQIVYHQISFFDVMRAPEFDAHMDSLKDAGQIVRVWPYTDQEGRAMFQVAPDGGEVILWDKELRNSHLHGPNRHGQIRAYDPLAGGGPEGHGFKGVKTMPYWMLVLAGMGIFLGCVGKSAQFPLQVWLPDAMEGPTPVSALVHSATMVAAGVYLVGRVYPLFTPEVLLLIAYTGAATAFIAATIAIVQTDIKKVLAWSTVSQLGFMMLGLGVGGWTAGLFHLITHAFFKALLFLCSGSVIYGCHHEQDMTRMGGLYPKMKITALTMLMGVLAICGTPLFAGWYSKDAVLVSSLSFVSLNPQHFLLFLLPLGTAGITAFYMFRLWFMTFTGKPRDEHVYEHARESPAVMTVPLVILAVCAVVVAWGQRPWDVQDSAMEHYLHHGMPASLHVDTGLSLSTAVAQAGTTASGGNFFAKGSWLEPVFLKMFFGPHDVAGVLALVVAGLGVLLAFIVYYWKLLDAAENKERFATLYRLFANKWYFDELYSALLVRPALVVGQWARAFDARFIDGLIDGTARVTVRLAKFDGKFDLGVVDGLVNVTAKVVYAVGDWLRGAQTGLIRNYVLFMAVAAVGIIALLSYVVALAG